MSAQTATNIGQIMVADSFSVTLVMDLTLRPVLLMSEENLGRFLGVVGGDGSVESSLSINLPYELLIKI